MATLDTVQLAHRLDTLRKNTQETGRLTTEFPTLKIDQAYVIQDEIIKLHVGEGERVVGMKMGLTSRAKMRQMGIAQPIYGTLTDRMHLVSGSEITLRGLIHPKIEPEIAFRTRINLSGPISPEQALAGCASVFGAMEIIDSRYKDFSFALPDVIADNCSSSLFVTGPEVALPGDLDLGNLGMVMEINGVPVKFAASSAILGHPAQSLAALCHLLHARGRSLPAGSIVLAGGATEAVLMEPGQQIRLQVQGLPDVSLRVNNGEAHGS